MRGYHCRHRHPREPAITLSLGSYSSMEKRMEKSNVFVLLEFNPFDTGVRFVEKARELNLHPVLFSRRPSKYRLPAGLECLQLEDITKDSVLGAIDRLGR